MFPSTGAALSGGVSLRRVLSIATVLLSVVVSACVYLPAEEALGVVLCLTLTTSMGWAALSVLARRRLLMRREEMVRRGVMHIDDTCDVYDDVSSAFVGWPTTNALLRIVDSAAPSTEATENVGECVMCLDDMCARQSIRTLPCRHKLHTRCADLWLVQTCRNVCPICSTLVVEGRDADMRVS